MEIITKAGIVNIELDTDDQYTKAEESITDLLDSIPFLIARGINSFIESREAIRPEDNLFVDFWPESGDDLSEPSPCIAVTLRPISDEDDFVNVQFPLWGAIKRAVGDEDEKPMRVAAEELRKMADFIDNEYSNPDRKKVLRNSKRK